MTYLVEDATYGLVILGIAAAACLAALRITQDGRYLVWAGGLLAASLALFALEWFWVTDAERVEAVVYDLADAVEKSDVDRVKALLDPEVSVTRSGRMLDDSLIFGAVLAQLPRTRFDSVRISRLQAQVGRQTRMGTAEFRALAFGSYDMSMGGSHAFASGNTEWSLAFREAEPGRWLVTRITPTQFPAIGYIPGFGARPRR
ncbi:hypothetical protein TA3x_001909 [Tundrisphaera sp. TA3]|uniref:hypothetical protein n=1 Tax=Tundrisphaera sp. TA3 TaxID=3435775 RepID=UPI003EBDAC0B